MTDLEGLFLASSVRLRAAARPGRKIMVVEEKRELSEIFNHVLNNHPTYEVESVRDHLLVFKRLAETCNDFALVCLDINEGGNEELHLLDWIREQHPLLPLFIITEKMTVVTRVRQRYPEIPILMKGLGGSRGESLMDVMRGLFGLNSKGVSNQSGKADAQ